MTDRLTVVHYIPRISFTSAGLGVYMQLLAKELGKLVKIIIVTHESNADLRIENAKVIDLPLMTVTGKRCRHVFEYMLDTLQPDIVHTHGCWFPLCGLLPIWAKKRGYKVMTTIHGMLEPYIIRSNYWKRKVPALLLYQKKALKQVDCLIATAEEERQNILRLGYNDRVEVVPIGLDASTITMKTSWQNTGKIVFLSRIHPKKGIEFLLQAVADMGEELNAYTIYIYGMGDQEYIDKLQQQAHNLGVTDRVVFAGSVRGEEKWRVLREADLFVLPTHSENFGIAIAEALASGTPVITTKGTPWRDIESQHCGWWTEIGVEPTKEALRSFINMSESELETMGRNGRRLIEEKYSDTAIAKQMVNIYEKLLKE